MYQISITIIATQYSIQIFEMKLGQGRFRASNTPRVLPRVLKIRLFPHSVELRDEVFTSKRTSVPHRSIQQPLFLGAILDCAVRSACPLSLCRNSR